MIEEYIDEWIYKRRNSRNTHSITFSFPRDFPFPLENGDYVVKLYRLIKASEDVEDWKYISEDNMINYWEKRGYKIVKAEEKLE